MTRKTAIAPSSIAAYAAIDRGVTAGRSSDRLKGAICRAGRIPGGCIFGGCIRGLDTRVDLSSWAECRVDGWRHDGGDVALEAERYRSVIVVIGRALVDDHILGAALGRDQ